MVGRGGTLVERGAYCNIYCNIQWGHYLGGGESTKLGYIEGVPSHAAPLWETLNLFLSLFFCIFDLGSLRAGHPSLPSILTYQSSYQFRLKSGSPIVVGGMGVLIKNNCLGVLIKSIVLLKNFVNKLVE